ncbi:MAG: phospho-N-acetylmuramoyl-pentapeptide-transferase [Actinomycetia bacterium]|nr:phospho-N-acetylmuramoyl-pentapeptide-transferase [Actinomycetes bacterium]
MLTKLAQYPTFQVFLALAVSVLFVVVLTPLFIRLLNHRQIGQQVRVDGPAGHLRKQGTPTMGGVVILLIVSLVFAGLTYIAAPRAVHATPDTLLNYTMAVRGAVLVLVTTLACGLLGMIDDLAKVAFERSLGLKARAKLIGQILIALASAVAAVNWVHVVPRLQIPATRAFIDLGALTSRLTLSTVTISLPWLYLAFAVFMIVAVSNSVNLTDGLDGLAAGIVMIVTAVFAAIAYAQNSLPISLLAAAISGACIGFLWYNNHPADIFMGDTGSLGLGAAVATLAMVTRTELILPIIGGVFVVEALSVIIQVAVYKRFKRRVFKMAPIHHHFEMLGWSETKVMVRFWIIAGSFAALGFVIFFFQFTRLGR